MIDLRLMYGLFSKLTVIANLSESNHHGTEFPANLAFHTHNGNQTTFYTGNFQRGVTYPYLFSGVDLYAKYRFLSLDGQHTHLRMALFGEWSNASVAHDEAEPTLMGDTRGYSGGLIVTALKNHLAVSLTTGFIIPGKYDGTSPDPMGGPDVPTELIYGRAVTYDLSFGYLLFPLKYQNYNETNMNVYMEFKGKSYGSAQIYQYGIKPVPIQTPLLEAGNYMEAYPGIQAIIKSNLRIDFSVGFPIYNTSYARFYPVYMIGIQRYFYLKK
ncbi:MAG TPA: hypothetical protein VGO45_10820 [Bacteroidia bacterium]|nr:hypothetical protein [Bacteroidia bacterium]